MNQSKAKIKNIRRLTKAIAILAIAVVIAGLNIITHPLPAVSQSHHSSPAHSLPKSTTTSSKTSTPSPQATETEGFINQGLEKLQRQDYAGALKDFDRVIALKGDHKSAYLHRGDIYSKLGNYREAVKDYTIAIEKNPFFSYIYNQRGKAYETLKNYQRAIEDYTQAIKIYPEDGVGYTNRGIAYFKTQNNQKAMADFNKAIEVNNGQADAYFNRGKLYAQLGNRQAAIKDYHQARALYSEQGKKDEYLKTTLVVTKLQQLPVPTAPIQ